MSPLEKMARAIAEAFYTEDMGPEEAKHFAVVEWPDFIPEARAALLAIREPDEGMIEAWYKAAWPRGPVVAPLSQAGLAFRRNHAAMIDAILNQEPRP